MNKNYKNGNNEEFKQKLFFDGQIYEAYNLVINLIKRAKEKILIIDNYIAFYRIKKDEIQIIRVLYGMCNYETIL